MLQNERKVVIKRGAKLYSLSLVVKTRLGVQLGRQGTSPGVPALCTRECFVGRAEAAGTIYKSAHCVACVALLTPASASCRGGVRVAVWLLLDDDEFEWNCGAGVVGLSIARPTLLLSGHHGYFRHEVDDYLPKLLRSLFTPICDT